MRIPKKRLRTAHLERVVTALRRRRTGYDKGNGQRPPVGDALPDEMALLGSVIDLVTRSNGIGQRWKDD
jgi:hypothetical protein